MGVAILWVMKFIHCFCSAVGYLMQRRVVFVHFQWLLIEEGVEVQEIEDLPPLIEKLNEIEDEKIYIKAWHKVSAVMRGVENEINDA